MYEEKRIKQALIRNTFLFFIVFTLIFSVLGVFVFQTVNTNIFKAADRQLSNQTSTASISLIESTGTAADDNTVSPDEAGDNFNTDSGDNTAIFGESGDTPDSPHESLITKSVIEYSPTYPFFEENFEAGSPLTDDFEETHSYSNSAQPSSPLLVQSIEKNIEDNPQTVYLFRDTEGILLDTFGVKSSYPDYLATMPFDKSISSEIHSIKHEGHHFRSFITELQTTEGTLYYSQALINVDSEIEILERFTQTLVIGLLGALLACATASYLLSKRTIQPIAEAWNKQTEFVQNASHELRTPLTVIQTTQELLLEDPHAKIIDHFEDITLTLEESERLRSLAENLLLLSASDSQNVSIEATRFSFDKLVEDTATIFLTIAEQERKKVTLNLTYGKMISGNDEKIRQALIILIDNALKYTEAGDTIHLASSEQAGMASLTVADTGIGMSNDDLEHALDRFFRADKARSRTTDGMGLGLSLAQSILESHGGSIKISHHKPKGIMVTIQIPSDK